jgi:hypothetical protein
MITANCRDRFTAEDFDFVVQTLATSEKDSVSLVKLLTDAETRDEVLDHPRLLASVLEDGAPLRISPQLYFYILTRHVLKETGIESRPLSDYVASVLEKFSHRAGMRSPADGSTNPIQYLSDMLVALRQASPTQTFLIRAHVGNYSLFISGIFRECVVTRAQRGAPDMIFYEDMGRASYRAAAGHHVARSVALDDVYEQLSDSFREVRCALNHLSDSLLHLSEGPNADVIAWS